MTFAWDVPETEGLVSCIVPVYNGERFLGEALDSILAQSYAPIEIFVVDDGSTDGTSDVVGRYGEAVQYSRQPNAGPGAARNRGIRQAGGEFIAFLDADDIWLPDKTSHQVAKLRERPELDFCVGHMKSFFMPERSGEKEQFSDHSYHQPRAAFSPCTVLARRSLFADLGGFDPTLRSAEDTDWFLRAFSSGRQYEVLADLLVERRLHANNITSEDPPSPLDVVVLLKRRLDEKRSGGS